MPRRLIVYSDPGGAKPCLALAARWAEASEVKTCADRVYRFSDGFGVQVQICRASDWRSIIADFKPTSIFTGTSYTSRLELHFLAEAVRRRIPTAAFVDHYTKFRERFTLDGADVFPDEIHVLDAKAQRLALGAGLPADRIRITGNPYHEYLKTWKSKMSAEDLLQRIGLSSADVPLFLFAPDPLSNAGGATKFGTDESCIVALLLKAIDMQNQPVRLIIKPHPNQNIAMLEKTASEIDTHGRCQVMLAPPESDAYVNELIHQSDLVVGIFSSIILEAELLKRERCGCFAV